MLVIDGPVTSIDDVDTDYDSSDSHSNTTIIKVQCTKLQTPTNISN